MAERFCESLFDLSDPDSPKLSQAISDLQQNILRNDKNDDDSGGDDSDYETMENGTGKGEKGKEDKPQGTGNQILIKKKNTPVSMSLGKKKK